MQKSTGVFGDRLDWRTWRAAVSTVLYSASFLHPFYTNFEQMGRLMNASVGRLRT